LDVWELGLLALGGDGIGRTGRDGEVEGRKRGRRIDIGCVMMLCLEIDGCVGGRCDELSYVFP
jgi:hypothetical protein